MAELKEVEMVISEQGAVRVNEAWIHRESPEIVCVRVDLASKRAEFCTSDCEGVPEFVLFAGEGTLHLDEAKHRESLTGIQFPQYRGWDVFIAELSKYTLSIVFVKPEPPQQ